MSSFRPDHAADLIGALSAAGWQFIASQYPYYNEPWLRMERQGQTLMAGYDNCSRWAETLQIDQSSIYHSDDWKRRRDAGEGVPLAELLAFAGNPSPRAKDWRFSLAIPAGLLTPAEQEAARIAREEQERRTVALLALECQEVRGNQLNSFLWFTVPAHLRDAVAAQRRELRKAARAAARLSAVANDGVATD